MEQVVSLFTLQLDYFLFSVVKSHITLIFATAVDSTTVANIEIV